MTGRARIIPFERQGVKSSGPRHAVLGGKLFDTGEDSIFVMHGRGPSWDTDPETVPVHMHDEVDELIIIIDEREGYYLHGKTPETMVKSRFKGPCILYLPAREYHRIVTTSEGEFESFLTYSPAGTVLDRFDAIFSRAVHAEVTMASLPEEPLGP